MRTRIIKKSLGEIEKKGGPLPVNAERLKSKIVMAVIAGHNFDEGDDIRMIRLFVNVNRFTNAVSYTLCNGREGQAINSDSYDEIAEAYNAQYLDYCRLCKTVRKVEYHGSEHWLVTSIADNQEDIALESGPDYPF